MDFLYCDGVVGAELGLVLCYRVAVGGCEDEYGLLEEVIERVEGAWWEVESPEFNCVWPVDCGGVDDAVLLGGVETSIGGWRVEGSC